MPTAITSFCQITGGLALFLYGIDLAAQGLRTAAAARLSMAIRMLARNRVLAVLAGVFVTLCLQSSGATMALLVSLVDVGMLSLMEAMSLIIGASIGTTLTIQIIAFDISRYAMLLFAVGFLIQSVSKYRRHKAVGGLLMGFGMVFLGMRLLSQGMVPFRELHQVTMAVKACSDYPLLGVVVSAVVTAILLSSHATLAIALALASQNMGTPETFRPLLSLGAAVPIVLGANIGTCAAAFLASLKCNRAGKQVALAQLLFKLVGVLIFLPFLHPFSNFVAWITSVMTGGGLNSAIARRQIANAHMFFNIGCAIVFLPWIGHFVKLVGRLLPAGPEDLFERTTYLANDTALLKDPEKAIIATWREISAMTQTVLRMFGAMIRAFDRQDDKLLDELEQTDDEIDLRNDAIMRLLAQLPDSSENARSCRNVLFSLSDEIESIGDLVSKTLVALGRKQLSAGITFSAQTTAHLRRVEARVLEVLDCLRKLFESPTQFEDLLPSLNALVKDLNYLLENPLELYSAERRAGSGSPAEAGAILLDTMGAFRQVTQHVHAIARILRTASEHGACETVIAIMSQTNREEHDD